MATTASSAPSESPAQDAAAGSSSTAVDSRTHNDDPEANNNVSNHKRDDEGNNNNNEGPRSDETSRNDDAVTAITNSERQKSEYAASVAAAASPSIHLLLSESVYVMLDGIPHKELKLIISEANECEKALEIELEQLKQALSQEVQAKQEKGDKEAAEANEEEKSELPSSVEVMLESEITPPDHYWTVSALLGRLRHDLTTPLPPNSQIQALREKTGLNNIALPPVTKKRKSNVGAAMAAATATEADEAASHSGRTTPNVSNSEISQFLRLKQIQNHPEYKAEHETTDKLLAVWKKISNHRSSLVFRRPVNPKDAPGYSERIKFPMDLSLIRKLIVNRTIRSYYDIAVRIHLIGHNCVKYNGRESDYALVTREFESYASEYLINATYYHKNPMVAPNPVGRPSKKITSTTPTAAASEVAPPTAPSASPLATSQEGNIAHEPEVGQEQVPSEGGDAAKEDTSAVRITVEEGIVPMDTGDVCTSADNNKEDETKDTTSAERSINDETQEQ